MEYLSAIKTQLLRNGETENPQIALNTRLVLLSGCTGLFLGSLQQAYTSNNQFLAENAHRLPTTSGGWVMYHSRKQQHIVHSAGIAGTRLAAKWLVYSSLFVVGTHYNPAVGGAAVAALYSALHKLGFSKSLKAIAVGAIGGGIYGQLVPSTPLKLQ